MIDITHALMDRHIKNCGGSRLGAAVLLYRTLTGMTTKEVGELAGTSATTISRIERGDSHGNTVMIAGIEAAFKIDRGVLLRVYFLDRDVKVSELPDEVIDLVVDRLINLVPEREPSASVPAPSPVMLVELADDREYLPSTYTLAKAKVADALLHGDQDVLDMWSNASDQERELVYAKIESASDLQAMRAADVLDIVLLYAKP